MKQFFFFQSLGGLIQPDTAALLHLPLIRRHGRAILLHFPSTAFHVAILRRGALQMGLQRTHGFVKVSPDSNPSSFLVSGMPAEAILLF